MAATNNSEGGDMKSWKEIPHLFCNGKFRIKYEQGNTFDLVGISHNSYSKKRVLLCYNYSGQVIDREIDKSTLIARPISDMSDKEIQRTQSYMNAVEFIEMNDNCEEEEHDLAKEWLVGLEVVCVKDFLYLLSIGVYPFDQSHFESGEVIARYENGEGK